MYLPQMVSNIDKWVKKVASHNGSPIIINDWIHFLTFDLMSDVGFSGSFEQIERETLHPAVQAVHESLKFVLCAIQVTWLTNLILAVFKDADPSKQLDMHAAQKLEERASNDTAKQRDIMSFLDTPGRSRQAAVDDASLLMIAASDTSYSALVMALYYLAADRGLQQRLRTEVGPSFSRSGDGLHWPTLQNLTLLDGILREVLRLHPPVSQGLLREVENHVKQPIQLGPVGVPPGTQVSIPTYSIQRDERYFVDADKFIPERWNDKKEMVLDNRAWLPFSTGTTACLGKHFAMMEMKIFIAAVVKSFDIRLPDGHEESIGRKLLHECKDHMTMWLPDVQMVFAPRYSDAVTK
jgi:cytochrome P450